eukprot:jgi/Chlat1/5617/Chrsp369S05408
MCFLRPKQKRVLLPPCEAVDLRDTKYNLNRIRAPRMAGLPLRLFAICLEFAPFRWLLLPKLLRDSGVPQVLEDVEVPERPTFEPIWPADIQVEPATSSVEGVFAPKSRMSAAMACLNSNTASAKDGGFHLPAVREFAHAFSNRITTPSEVADRILAFISDTERCHPPMHFFISVNEEDVRKQAAASTERYKQGRPLSVLDGVPIAIKDELDCLPYPTTAGTTWIARERQVLTDSTVAARLKACGAIILGKTNMHEIGIGTTGHNPHWGACRNPYAPGHYAGGSSAGSAAVVAAGICPIAIGCDGGGSIRIPASLCGVVGLKPTFGRVAVPICWTVAHVGPIAASVEDTLLAYAAIAGPDELDKLSLHQPMPRLPLMDATTVMTELKGCKIGVYSEWFADADPAVIVACQQALNEVQRRFGTETVDIKIPELEEQRVSHLVTITSEMCQTVDTAYRHGRQYSFALDTRISLILSRWFTNRDYILAQRYRTRLMSHHRRVLSDVDVIVTPTTAMTAPAMHADAAITGESDITVTGNLMRFIQGGNFVGLPAISVPVGYDSQGLPIGIQLIGRPWGEASLLRLASAIELVTAPYRQKPKLYCELRELLGQK